MLTRRFGSSDAYDDVRPEPPTNAYESVKNAYDNTYEPVRGDGNPYEHVRVEGNSSSTDGGRSASVALEQERANIRNSGIYTDVVLHHQSVNDGGSVTHKSDTTEYNNNITDTATSTVLPPYNSSATVSTKPTSYSRQPTLELQYYEESLPAYEPLGPPLVPAPPSSPPLPRSREDRARLGAPPKSKLTQEDSWIRRKPETNREYSKHWLFQVSVSWFLPNEIAKYDYHLPSTFFWFKFDGVETF